MRGLGLGQIWVWDKKVRVGMRTRLFASLYIRHSLETIRRVSREGQLSCLIISVGPVAFSPVL